MAPKKPAAEEVSPGEEEEKEEVPPQIEKRCFRDDGILFYGDVIAPVKKESSAEEAAAVPAEEGSEKEPEVLKYVKHGHGVTFFSKRCLDGTEVVYRKHEGRWYGLISVCGGGGHEK